MRIWVAVGCKFGDLCSVLPIIYNAYKQTGAIQEVMVSERYASLFLGCSYIKPIKWKGEWHDLRGAIVEAKKIYEEITVLSTFGKDWPVEKQTPSFQLDQWRRAGQVDSFGAWPLLFDERNSEREANLREKSGCIGKYILVCDTSESSQFADAGEIKKLVHDNFPDYKIVALSDVKADFFFDLIGLYDKAACLVSIETSHLHLSAASGIPVIALVTDKPEIWHGSAYQKRYIKHIRYSDFELRKSEIVEAIKMALALRSPPEIEIKTTDGYNPTIFGDKLIYRRHPDPSHWRTELVLSDGKTSSVIKPPKGFEAFSIEDGRLFTYKGKPHISYTVGRTVAIGQTSQHRCVMQYGELVNRSGGWQIENMFQPKYGRNDFSGMEKNWSCWRTEGKLYCAYQRSPEQIILEIEGDKIIREFKTKSPACSFGEIRGGTEPLPFEDGLLQFYHTNRTNRKSAYWWLYSVGALVMDSKPPFQIRRVSKHPILVGTEQYFPDWKFWKPKCCLPYGSRLTPSGFDVSIGINDSASAIAHITHEHLNL